MKRYLIITVLLLSTSFSCFSQESIILQGNLNEKDTTLTSKNTAQLFVLVKMIINDSIYQSTFINRKGFFEFYKPCPAKNYELGFFYLGYRMRPTIQIREVKNNNVILDCQFNLKHFVDSIESRKDFEFPNCITYAYCGLPAYSDFSLSKYSFKYGFRYENLGCYSFDEKEVNKKAIVKLNKSLGDNWEKVFWIEIESKLK